MIKTISKFAHDKNNNQNSNTKSNAKLVIPM